MAPRTPLLRPKRFFKARDVSFVRALGIVAVLTVSMVVAVYLLGWIVSSRLDGTATVDNPARPPDAMCENDFFDRSGCDEPETVERNVGSIFSEAAGELAIRMIWLMPVAWVLVGLLLHAGSWLAGGENGVGASFAVAAWGLVPSLASTIVGLGVLYLTFDPMTVTSVDDPAALQDRIVGELGALRSAGPLVGVVTVVWSGVIWRYGLEHARALSTSRATVIAAVVTVFGILSAVA